MKAFADLYNAIDETNKTNDKVAAMVRYFQEAPPADAAWAVHFLIGRRPKRQINSTKMQAWAAEQAGIEDWLFGECYDAVGDLAETISLVLPDNHTLTDDPQPLHKWIEDRLLTLGGLTEEEQHELLIAAWNELDRLGRFVFNKLITGAFRVGVSQDLVVRALAKASKCEAAVISHRLMGDWTPTAEFYERLVGEDEGDTEVSKPYPFCLAHPVEGGPEDLGNIEEWHAEWKWDGIRAQVIRRQGQSFIWSRGEELITDRFPEIRDVADALPDGTVLDGEILAWSGGKPLKFLELQKRIGRKIVSKKIMQDVPVVLVAFDVLESNGQDVRERPFAERRQILTRAVEETNERRLVADGPIVDERLAEDPSVEADAEVRAHSRLLLATHVEGDSWEALAEQRQTSRDLNVEGLMLKRKDAPYLVGRKKGVWWKWKIEPFTVDAVLIYAQRGSGKRASLYTDYTFGVWDDEGKLVPFAKAYSGLNDQEIAKVDAFVRRNTLEKFGPVRTVTPELVFELAFEGIQLSTRHKSGVAVRFPRIARWRHDKKPADADSLQTIKDLLLVER